MGGNIKMKLYMVIESWDYAGGNVLGVYDTFKQALARTKSSDYVSSTKEIHIVEVNEDVNISV
jgi:hypothetical protein